MVYTLKLKLSLSYAYCSFMNQTFLQKFWRTWYYNTDTIWDLTFGHLRAPELQINHNLGSYVKSASIRDTIHKLCNLAENREGQVQSVKTGEHMQLWKKSMSRRPD